MLVVKLKVSFTFGVTNENAVRLSRVYPEMSRLRKLSSQRVCLVFYSFPIKECYLIDGREEEVVLGLKEVVSLVVQESELGHALEVVSAALAQHAICQIVVIAELIQESGL